MEQLAAKIGMTPSGLSMLERGQSWTTPRILDALAEALKAETGWLLKHSPGEGDGVLALYGLLPPEQKRSALEILKALKRAE